MNTFFATAMEERSPFFTGREEILTEISSVFATASMIALQGIEGVGKTQIAREYVHRHRDNYEAIICLNASSHVMLSGDVRMLVDQFSLAQGLQTDPLLFATLKDWLQVQKNWLLVLDHIDDLSLTDLVIPFPANGHVLLTTALDTVGSCYPLAVSPMSTDTAALFLLRRVHAIPMEASLENAPDQMVQDARSLAELQGGVPLALELAGATIETMGESIESFLNEYRQLLMGKKRGKKLVEKEQKR